jgi:methylenetetrahydrofolate dehydrogenase (NADP+)/methenyltetrahydrofolate cyclohydrolase
MSARLLDGTALALQIRQELRGRITEFTVRAGRPPGLGIVLVGDNPASAIYVRNKLRAAGESGFRADLEQLPASTSLDDVLACVTRLNQSDAHDGILVQAPLPASMGAGAAQAVFDAISPDKDVDGFNPTSVGRLVQGRAILAPGTPSGIIALLERSGIRIGGTRAVIIGRSDIVGKPMALLLMHRDATVTVCHSKTPDLPAISATADILIAAIGRVAFVRRSFVKPGATVVDVGINRVSDPAQAREILGAESPRLADFERRGSVVIGDVHPEVAEVAGALTPVPGGVGPLTIAMLLSNTLKAAETRLSAKQDTLDATRGTMA